MAYKDKSKAIEYNNKFIAETYDRVNLTMPKGKKEILQSHVKAQGKSLNGFINEAIDEKIQRDSATVKMVSWCLRVIGQRWRQRCGAS